MPLIPLSVDRAVTGVGCVVLFLTGNVLIFLLSVLPCAEAEKHELVLAPLSVLVYTFHRRSAASFPTWLQGRSTNYLIGATGLEADSGNCILSHGCARA